MDLTATERDLVAQALAPRRGQRARPRVRRAIRNRRRAGLDRDAFARAVLTTPEPRAVGTLTTLDTAAHVRVRHGQPDDEHEIDAIIEPPARGRNVVRLYQARRARPRLGFHVPGLWIADVDWIFRFPVPSDVLLNAVSFVQASGVTSVFAAGWVLGDSFAEVDFATRLDLIVVSPPPQDEAAQLGPGDRDDGPRWGVRTPWWDAIGRLERTEYDVQSTLIEKSFSPVAAGSTAFVVVSATVALSADGSAFSVADFRDGHRRLDVPGVYLSTFPNEPIA